MTWEQVGAIAGIASFVLTFVLHWDRLRGLTINRILVPGLVGIVVFMLFNQIGPMVFGAPINIPLIHPQLGDQPVESSIQPTELSSSSSQAKYPCPMLITQSEVDSWKLGQTDVQTVHRFLDQFDSKRPDDAGAFVAGVQIPAGVLVATNYDETDASKWTQYDVIPIVHSGSWGLFQTTREYAAPRPGACMTIIP